MTPDYTNNEFTAFYKMLNGLKHSHPALRAGESGGTLLRYPAECDDVYVFSRTLPSDEVVVMVNLSDSPAPVKFKDKRPSIAGKKDYFSSAQALMPDTLAPWEYRIYVP